MGLFIQRSLYLNTPAKINDSMFARLRFHMEGVRYRGKITEEVGNNGGETAHARAKWFYIFFSVFHG